MKMTIENAITWLNTEDYESKGFADATSVAIETMRKYQKIEEIVGNYGFDASWVCIKKIRKVMEDGNDK